MGTGPLPWAPVLYLRTAGYGPSQCPQRTGPLDPLQVPCPLQTEVTGTPQPETKEAAGPPPHLQSPQPAGPAEAGGPKDPLRQGLRDLTRADAPFAPLLSARLEGGA